MKTITLLGCTRDPLFNNSQVPSSEIPRVLLYRDDALSFSPDAKVTVRADAGAEHAEGYHLGKDVEWRFVTSTEVNGDTVNPRINLSTLSPANREVVGPASSVSIEFTEGMIRGTVERSFRVLAAPGGEEERDCDETATRGASVVQAPVSSNGAPCTFVFPGVRGCTLDTLTIFGPADESIGIDVENATVLVFGNPGISGGSGSAVCIRVEGAGNGSVIELNGAIEGGSAGEVAGIKAGGSSLPVIRDNSLIDGGGNPAGTARPFGIYANDTTSSWQSVIEAVNNYVSGTVDGLNGDLGALLFLYAPKGNISDSNNPYLIFFKRPNGDYHHNPSSPSLPLTIDRKERPRQTQGGNTDYGLVDLGAVEVY